MENDLNKVFHLNSKRALQEISDYINELEAEIIETKKALLKYDKDAEIAKRDKKIKYLQEHSLLEITDNEKQRIKEFRNKHHKKCNNGNTYDYRISGTGLGTILIISCPYCGNEEDVTDVSGW